MSETAGGVASPADEERRSRLLGIKLRALVGEHLGRVVDVEPAGFPGGAAMVVDGAAWVLVDGSAARSLGPALAWTIRQGATSLDMVAELDAGAVARRARHLDFPATIWFPEGRVLLPVVPEPLPTPVAPLDEHLDLVPVIEAAGATVNVEHGVVVGEVRGLEVCRVVDQPTVGHFAELGDIDAPAIIEPQPDGGVLLEVGVGANDREAFRMLHGDIPTLEALTAVVDSVLEHRSPDAPQHPLNRLGQERYLRWQLEVDPSLVDLVSVEAAEPPQPRPNLKDPLPCLARGVDEAGREITVICSVGVDLDLVSFVADVQEMVDCPVVVVLRSRDAVAITRDVLGLLSVPVDVRLV